MRSRRVILRLAPYVLTFGLLGSALMWQDAGPQEVADDLGGTPAVSVDETAVPTVRTDVPVEPIPDGLAPQDSLTPGTSEYGQGGAEVDPDGTPAEPSADAPVTIAELTPKTVDPFGLVGVTWASGVPKAAEVEVQWRGKDGWSDWQELHQVREPEEGRPGTEPQWVGWADAVAVRVVSAERAEPVDLQIATVDPGKAGGIIPAAVAQPNIILRSQWGAKAQTECATPTYGSTTLGAVIHHTVGSNSYTRAQSAGIVRSIQAYHMSAQNWCDIGYNFLVDRYGQIFEGRAGGINRPVRAAHSGNATVNELTMGVSMMGTFTNAAPPQAMKDAVARLVAWRFANYRVPATGTVKVGSKTLNRISGHRDVIGTECPGAYAYAWLSESGGLRATVAKILASGGVGPPGLTGFRGAARGTSVIDYHWNPVRKAPKYQILISRSSSYAGAVSRYVTATGTRFSGLTPGATYYAKVRAVGSTGGGFTKWTGSVVRTTAPPPGQAGVPQGLHWTKYTSSTITVEWKAVPKAATYQIRLSRYPSMARPSVPMTSGLVAQFSGLSSNTTYYAQVRAISSAKTQMGTWSKRITVKTKG